MKNFHQLKLALWKDWTLSKRQPVTLILIFVWPIFIFSMLMVVRHSVEPSYEPSCHFAPRALPSAGLVPFVQSFLCNIDNECVDIEKQLPSFDDTKIGRLISNMTPIFSNESFLEIVDIVPQGMKLLKNVMLLLNDDDVETLLLRGISLRDILKDTDQLSTYLENDMDKEVFEQLIDGKINILNMVLVARNHTKEEILCDNELLHEFLYVDEPYMANISESLCRLNITDELTSNLLGHVKFEQVLKKVDNIFKSIYPDTIFADIGKTVDTIFKLRPLEKFIPANFSTAADWFPEIIPIIDQLNTTDFDMNDVKYLIDYVDPGLNKTKDWKLVKRSTNNMASLFAAVQDLMRADPHGGVDIADTFKKLKLDLYLLQKRANMGGNGTSTDMYESLDSAYKLISATVALIDRVFSDEKETSAVSIFINIMDIVKDVFPFVTNLDEYGLYINDLLQITNYLLETHIDTPKLLTEILNKNRHVLDILKDLGPIHTQKMIESLGDIENAQILLKNINNGSVIFCDAHKLQKIFSTDEIKNKLCTDEWIDFVEYFGQKMHYSDVIDSINHLGADNRQTSSIMKLTPHHDKASFVQLYTNLEKLLNTVSYLFVKLEPSKNDQYKIDDPEWKPFNDKFDEHIDSYLLSMDLAIVKNVIETGKFPKSYLYDTLNIIEVLVNTIQEIFRIISVNAPVFDDSDVIVSSNANNQSFDWSKFAASIQNTHQEFRDMIDKDTKTNFKRKLDLKNILLLSVRASTGLLEIFDSRFESTPKWQRMKHIASFLNKVARSLKDTILSMIENGGLDPSKMFKQMPRTAEFVRVVLKGLPEIFNSTSSKDRQFIDDDVVINFIARNHWPCSGASLSTLYSIGRNGAAAIKKIEDALCVHDKYIDEWKTHPYIVEILHAFSKSDTPSEFQWRQGYVDFKKLVTAMDKLGGYNGTYLKDYHAYGYQDLVNTWTNSIEHKNDSFVRTFFKVIDNYATNFNRSSASLSDVWFDYDTCIEDGENCTEIENDAIKQTLLYIPQALHGFLDIILGYYDDITNPASDLLKAIGFFENSGVYTFYAKLPELINAFLFTYQSDDFRDALDITMNATENRPQCKTIFELMEIPENSTLTNDDILKLADYVCPSLMMPVLNENTFLKISGTAQNLYFEPIDSFNVSYENLYDKLIYFSHRTEAILADPPTFAIESVLTKTWLDNLQNTVLKFLMETGRPPAPTKLPMDASKPSRILELITGHAINILSFSMKYYKYEGECAWCSNATVFINEINTQLRMSEKYAHFICDASAMNFTEFFGILRHDFGWDRFPTLLSTNQTYAYEDFVHTISDTIEIISEEFLPVYGNQTFAKQTHACFENFKNSTIGTNIQSFAHFISTLMNFTSARFNQLDGLLEIQTSAGPFLKFIEGNAKVSRPLSEILKSKSAFQNRLTETGFSKQFIRALMGARIRINQLAEIDTTINVRDLFEPDEHLDEIWPENVTTLRKITHDNINFTFVNENVPKWRHEYIWGFTWIPGLIKNSGNIFKYGKDIKRVVDNLSIRNVRFGGQNTDIFEIADAILQMFQQATIDTLYSSLEGLMNGLDPLLNKSVLGDDLSAILKGIDSLRKMITSGYIKFKYDVKALFGNWDGLNDYFVDVLHLSPDVAEAISDGQIDLTPILTGERRLKDFICDPKNIHQVLVNSSADSSHEIARAVSRELCAMPPEYVQNMTATLLGRLSYVELFDGFINVTLNRLFRKSDLSDADGRRVLARLKRAATFAPEFKEYAGEIPDLLNQTTSDEDEDDDGIEKLSSLICEKKMVRNTNKIQKMLADEIRRSEDLDKGEYETLTDSCKILYETVINMDNGKIMWAYIKPLLRGKILVAPRNHATEQITRRMNSTFLDLSIVGKTATGTSAIVKFISDVNLMNNSMKILKEIASDPDSPILSLMNIDPNFFKEIKLDAIVSAMGNVDTDVLKSTTERLSHLMNCVDYNRFEPVADETELERKAATLMSQKEFLSGIVFTNDFDDGDATIPKHISYKIRMDIDNVPTTTMIKSQFWAPGPEADFRENLRYFRGFVQLQDMIDTAVIDIQSDGTATSNGIYTQQFPYPCWKNDIYQTGLYVSQTLMASFFFGLIVLVGSIIRDIVWERESQNVALMSIMGMKFRNLFASWFLISLAKMWIAMVCVFAIIKGGHVIPNTDPVILLVFLLTYGVALVTFCFMVSTMFKSASLACAVGAIYFLFTFIPYMYHIVGQLTISYGVQIIMNLFVSSSLSYALMHATRYEVQDVGLQWSNLWVSSAPTETMSAGTCFIFIVIDAALYLIVGLIIMHTRKEQVRFKNSAAIKINDEVSKVGVSLDGITKIYKSGRSKKVAVDDVSLRLYSNQITSILGHNGAGKTTLINMLTGMSTPTCGEIAISDPKYDPAHSTRQYLGVCPQSSILFGKMSAREHLTFYAQLKTSDVDVRDDVDSMLDSMNLGASQHEPVANLSGGTRRRLSVAIAFIGGPSLVVLDEPSSGVDPVARRRIWELIVDQKRDRTVVLTTHHLDEAELLSDRVVILRKGKVHCSGPPLTLKQNHGHGYLLDVIYDTQIDHGTMQILFDALVDVIPNVRLMNVSKDRVTMALPFLTADGAPNNFEQAARLLESEKVKLGYREFYFNCTTFEKIFLNILRDADNSEEQCDENIKPSIGRPDVDLPENTRTTCRLHRMAAALFWKRLIHYSQDWRVVLTALILPMLFCAAAMGSYLLRPPTEVEPALRFGLDVYEPHAVSFISTSQIDTIQNRLFDSIGQHTNPQHLSYNKNNTHCTCTNHIQQCPITNLRIDPETNLYMLPNVTQSVDWLIDTQKNFIERRYGGWSFETDVPAITVWYNNKGYHALPSYLNALSNAILRTKCPNCTVSAYTHPLQLSPDKLGKDTLYQYFVDVAINVIVLVGFGLAASSGVVYLVNERVNEEKRLQYLSGVTPSLYWAIAFVWDYTIYVLSMAACLVVFELFALPVYVERDNLDGVVLIVLLYGWATISIVHFVERFFKDSSLANMFLFCGNVLVLIATMVCILVIDIIGTSQTAETVRYYLHNVFMVVPQYAAGNGFLQISRNYITADLLSRFGLNAYMSPTGWTLLGHHYVSMFCFGVVFIALNLLVEYKFVLIDKKRRKVSPFVLETVNLRKVFATTAGKKTAVDDLSLQIPPGQCFGLLGVNGAGKSTTFRMLISEIRQTSGEIYLENERAGGRTHDGRLGYCPQIDAMDPKLTTEQNLKLYGALKGIENVQKTTIDVMDRFGLTPYATRRFEDLSGGNKRKVCAAVSILGDARIVLMDEPTSGMDPASREMIADVIDRLIRHRRSVILTSHSMEECESLCTEVAIMIRGSVVCIGAPHELKSRYGGGYLVSVLLEDESTKSDLGAAMVQNFPACKLQNQQYRTSQYLIPNDGDVSVSEIFNKLGRMCLTYRIVDYLLERSSLDQVFIHLSNTWDDPKSKQVNRIAGHTNHIDANDDDSEDFYSVRL